MKIKIIFKYFMLVGIALTIATACNGQTKSNNNNQTMNESSVVIQETKNEIKYLANLHVYDHSMPLDQPQQEKDSTAFDLFFEIHTYPKLKTGNILRSQYIMYAHLIDGHYKAKLRLEEESLPENTRMLPDRDDIRERRISEWYTDDTLSAFVLNYYLSHQEAIPLHTQNIDVSQWNPLFTLYKNTNDQCHVLKLTINKVYPETKHVELGCELLGFSNILINGKLPSYSISTHTLLFYQGYNQYFPENMEYYVQLKHNTTKTYTNGGKDVTELTIPDRVEGYRPVREIEWCQKVLEYYLEHKSEMEMNMENK